MSERPLHLAIKEWYAEIGDQFEVPVEGFVIDIVREGLLIEVQTRSFSSIRQKLTLLLEQHPVRLVHPIAQEKWIIKVAADGKSHVSRRKSPKRGGWEHIFEELVSFPKLLAEPRFSLEVLLTRQDELRRHDGRRAWRRKGWVIQERRLLCVLERRLLETPEDLASLVPSGLAQPFTTLELAAAMGRPRRLAQQMAYCLREVGVLEPVGRQGNAIQYVRAV
jgi:hypothetical protein